MHGLVNRSLQCFLRDTYGAEVWARVALDARLPFDSFEPMLVYDRTLTDKVLQAAVRQLARPRESVLEDLGTYLVSHPNTEALRRLMRFGGVTFDDFLHSLEDLPERARLALPDLDLPALTLSEDDRGTYLLQISAGLPGAGHVMVGLLRAMADDYGALVLLDHIGAPGGIGAAEEQVRIQLLDRCHSSGRNFDLAGWGAA